MDNPTPSILIGATFTATPLEEPIAFWMQELHLPHQVAFAGYHQLFQTLLDPRDVFAANRSGINVALLRLEDLAAADASLSEIEAHAHELREAMIRAAAAIPAPLLVCLCPESAGFLEKQERQQFAARLRVRFDSDLQAKPNLIMMCADQLIADYEVTEVDDALAQQAGHVPYRPEFYVALGTQIARIAAGLGRRSPKVVAFDCDNTLWTGVCGEDGPTGVVVDPGRQAFQEFLFAQKRLGRLLAIASKNNEADVRETFEAHPEMPLRWRDITAHRINWQAKSGNLLELADELNVGVDSFVLLDDDGRECAEVRQDCPDAVVVQIPERSESLRPFLKRVWVLDHFKPLTAEDSERSKLYAEQSERKRFERQTTDLRGFLAGLRLQISFAPVTEETLPRVAQLSQRTNQMNSTLARFTESELKAQLAEGLEAFTVSVSDRFGNYGLVGAVFARLESNSLDVIGFLLSCRALGRGVEHQMLAHAAELALQHGRSIVRVAVRTGPRNQPAVQFLESTLGGHVLPGDAPLSWISAPADRLRSLELQVAGDTKREAIATTRPSTPATARDHPARVDYERIASELGTASSIARRIRERRLSQASAKRDTGTPPETELQRKLAVIWCDLLGLKAVGIEEDFFDLGGHSLLAVQLISRIHQDLGVVLPDSVVYGERLKISSLARTIELMELGIDDLAGYEAALAEVESLSDEEVAALLAEEDGY